MKKLLATATLALLGAVAFTAPAMANMGWERNNEGRACRMEANGERVCYKRQHRAWHGREFVVQDGQDVNSNAWTEGSVRATQAPHNSRGVSRPDTGNDSAYWINF